MLAELFRLVSPALSLGAPGGVRLRFRGSFVFERVDFEIEGSTTQIEVVYPRHGRNVEGAELVVRVPVGSRVHVEGVSAEVVVQGVRGDVDAESVSGNVRVSGARNDNYTSTFVFDNDHPCVGFDAPQTLPEPPGIYRNRPATGIARVVCYSPNHSLALAELEPSAIENLLGVWQEQYRELSALDEIKHVLIFENKGEAVGVSNPHPHCQIYATNFVFKTIETEASIDVELYARTILNWDRARLLLHQQSAVPETLEPQFSNWLARRER